MPGIRQSAENYFNGFKELEERGIKYVGGFTVANAKCEFECTQGHRWFSAAASVKRPDRRAGRGCPICTNRKKVGKEGHSAWCKGIGVELLDNYKADNRTKIRHRCIKHDVEFFSLPGRIRSELKKHGIHPCRICRAELRADRILKEAKS